MKNSKSMMYDRGMVTMAIFLAVKLNLLACGVFLTSVPLRRPMFMTNVENVMMYVSIINLSANVK